MSNTEHTPATTPLLRGQRRRLPSRRESTTTKMALASHRIFLTVGLYEDGQPGECFVTVEDAAVETRLIYDLLARCISLGLQYGVPLDKFVRQMTFIQGEIRGPVQGHDRIKFATSIPDLIGRELGVTYGGREDLAHVPQPSASAPDPAPTPETLATAQ